MKKLFLLLGFCFAAMAIQAQEASAYDYKIGYAESWTTYAPATVPNATTATDSIWYYTVLKESQKLLIYNIKISLDSVSGTVRRVPVILQGKVWASDSYTDITTKAWVLGSDTTINFTNFATSTLSGTMPSFVGTFPTYSDSTGYTGDFSKDSVITIHPNANVTWTPSATVTFAPNATFTLTNGILPVRYRYFRIYIKTALKGFVIKVPELSMLFKEQ